MVTIYAWAVAIILFLLSGIHLYWLAGGKKGIMAAIPSDGSKMNFQPTKLATGVVAGGLALAGWFALELGEVFRSELYPEWLLSYAGWAFAFIFILRAVGDFRWLGFFKKRKGSEFAKWDSLLYSPLCLFIGICFIYISNS